MQGPHGIKAQLRVLGLGVEVKTEVGRDANIYKAPTVSKAGSNVQL